MYGRLGCLDDANLLFVRMPHRNLYSWTAILSVHADHGCFEEALSLFEKLQLNDVRLEFFVFPVVFKVCSGLRVLQLGKQLHGLVTKYQHVTNIYVGNALIDLYGKCGSLDDAKKVLASMTQLDRVSWNSIVTACAANGEVYEALGFLERMSSSENTKPNLVSWSAIIGGFSQNGYDKEAVEMLSSMQAAGFQPNAQTLASVLPACARLQNLNLGKEIHGYVTRQGFMSNPFVVNGLLDMYRRCSDMASAHKIFSGFSVKNVISYNTMIVGYCEDGNTLKAKDLFDQMELAGKDIISWNSMISGYADNLMFSEALSMFRDLLMQEGIEVDPFTLGSCLAACTNMASLRRGKEIHAQAIVRGLHSNTFVGGALIELYSKCEDLKAAQLAFDAVTERDTVTWNLLISGYACSNQIENIQNLIQKMKGDDLEPNVYTWNGIISGHVENGHHELALRLFADMQTLNLRPDIYTVGIILPACARLATIARGKQVHAHSIRRGYESDVHIGAALIDMYAKSGSIKHAMQVCNRISNPNLVSQNAMLTSYAMHGHGEEGISLFRSMLGKGIRPDHVTFLSVLSSCVHAGAVETGNEFFDLMAYYNVRPGLKHYTCIVDLLSRAGRLDEAYELIKNVPVEPDSVVWGTLLGGCVIWGNVDLGEIAAGRLIELEPNNTGNYVQLANLYACAGRWYDLARTRQIIKERGMHKSPGCSWIEDRDEIHVFLSCDRTHEKTDDIYTTLGNLNTHMRTELEQVYNCNNMD